MKKLLIVILMAIVLLPLFYKGARMFYVKYKIHKAENSIGTPIEDIAGTDIHGKTYRLKEYRGKNIIIVFWASWCGSCMKEIPNIKAFYKNIDKYPDVLFLSSSVDKSVDTTLKTVKEKGINYPVIIDRSKPGKDSGFNRHFQIVYLPSIWVINKKGIITHQNIVHIEDALKALNQNNHSQKETNR